MPHARPLRPAARTLLALATAACGAGDATTGEPLRPSGATPSARLLGRWQKPEPSLPPVTLELRAEGSGVVGRVWLSGITYEAPAVTTDTSFVLGAGRPSMRGALTADGRLRVHFLGATGTSEREELLARVP